MLLTRTHVVTWFAVAACGLSAVAVFRLPVPRSQLILSALVLVSGFVRFCFLCVSVATMSSLTNSADDWGDLFPAATPSPTAASQGSGSGEFSSFVFLGGDKDGAGGGAKRSLFFSGRLEKVSGLCLGCVAATKFCLKPITCSIGKHETVKFKLQAEAYYVKVSDSAALCAPVLGTEWQTSPTQHERLMEQRLTSSEWEGLFKKIIQGAPLPSWLADEANKATGRPDLVVGVEVSSPEIVSPIRMEEKLGLFSSLPRMAEDSDSEDGEDTKKTEWEVEVPAYVVKALRALQRKVKKVESLWNPTFQEVEMSYVDLVTDLQKLRACYLQVQAGMGAPVSDHAVSVWKAIEDLKNDVAVGGAVVSDLQDAVQNSRDMAAQARLGVARNQEGIEELKVWWSKVVSRLDAAEEKLEVHAKRFENIRPAVAAVRGLLEQSRMGAAGPDELRMVKQMEQVKEEVQDLKRRIDKGNDSAWNMLGHDGGNHDRLDAAMRDIAAKVKLLEQRVVGDGVQIGSQVFQSFEDLRAWVTTELPNGRYGLFVDGVAFLDLFTFTGFTETEKSIAAMHNSQKTGFATMYEARAAATLQNVFPLIFGKANSAGLDDSEYLPAISDPDKWDNGVTGIKHQISRAISDVEYQLETAIDSTFRDVMETRQIARDCLYGSKRFVTDLCVFITGDYNRWRLQGHSKKDSWRITSVCVRRIFEEMFSVRVVARDVRDAADPHYTAAKVLWAIFKSHEIMRAYIKGRFVDHPSIAAVISRHLAANFVKTDEDSNSKLVAMESKIKVLTARLDRYEAKSPNNGGKGKKKGGADE